MVFAGVILSLFSGTLCVTSMEEDGGLDQSYGCCKLFPPISTYIPLVRVIVVSMWVVLGYVVIADPVL